MSTCYQIANNTVSESNYRSCPNTGGSNAIQPCCDTGHAAQCLEGPICYQPAWVRDDGRATGFSMAGCTDENFDSEACQRSCASNSVPDVVYNETSGLWACCGTDDRGRVDCLNPLDGAFQGRSPQQLLGTAYTAPVIATASASSIATRSGATSASGTSASSDSDSNGSASSTSSSPGLSTGAKAGIGIGAAIGGLAVLIVLFVLTRRRKSKKRTSYEHAAGHQDLHTAPAELVADQYYKDYKEAPDTGSRRVEKDGQAVAELSADPVRPK